MKPLAGLSDAGIAMLAAMALFLIPVDRAKGIRAMDWDTAVKLPWGVLMLFGGGLTLATAIEANGVSKFIGNSSRGLAGLHPLVLLLAITAMTVFLSELTSNTAQVATMVPVLAAMAPVLGMNPYVLILACTLGASSAYMMPVGNAAERDRVRNRADADAADDEGRLLAEPRRHTRHHGAGDTPRRDVAGAGVRPAIMTQSPQGRIDP